MLTFSVFQPLPLTYEAYMETTKQTLLQEFLSRINSKQLEKPCPRPDSRGQLEINVKTRPTRPPFTLRSLLNKYAFVTVYTLLKLFLTLLLNYSKLFLPSTQIDFSSMEMLLHIRVFFCVNSQITYLLSFQSKICIRNELSVSLLKYNSGILLRIRHQRDLIQFNSHSCLKTWASN